MKIRYVVCAGWDTIDGERHFITSKMLAKLYELEPGEWISIADAGHWRYDALPHLTLREDGRYGRPDRLGHPPLRCPQCGGQISVIVKMAGLAEASHIDCSSCAVSWELNGDPRG